MFAARRLGAAAEAFPGRAWPSFSSFSSQAGAQREGETPLGFEVPSVEEEISASGAGAAMKPREVGHVRRVPVGELCWG